MTWPAWFTRMYEGVTEDLGWPPPPRFIETEDGRWKLERHYGWGTLVTMHASYEKALAMSQTPLQTAVGALYNEQYG